MPRVAPRPKTVLVTAGNTREMIDPVRYISNISTGVMGYEIAREARRQGFRTILISGPTALSAPRGVRLVSITSSADLKRQVHRYFPQCDYLFMTSAVCDFRPVRFSAAKIKRKDFFNLKLVKTPDILKGLAGRKGRRTLVGFCLETENLLANAKRKLRVKKVDYIVANRLGGGIMPFGHHPTTVTLIGRNGITHSLRGASKARVARFLIRKIITAAR